MVIKEDAKKILIRSHPEYNLFGNDYYMNIYRGCSHGCIYCDSRSECYQVKNFDTDIIVKQNAVDLLYKELRSKRKKGVIGVSGAMCDHYMPIEKSLKLTRNALKVIDSFGFAVQIHTKSDLVIRDIDILESINKKSNANVLFTITTANDDVSKLIEPNAPVTSKRFEAIKKLSDKGITTGIAIWPILPLITDSEENLRTLLKMAKEAGCKYVLIAFGVTLRSNQRDYFYNKLDSYGTNLSNEYRKIYGDSYVCNSKNDQHLKKVYKELCTYYNLETKAFHYKFKEPEQLSLF